MAPEIEIPEIKTRQNLIDALNMIYEDASKNWLMTVRQSNAMSRLLFDVEDEDGSGFYKVKPGEFE